MVILVTRSERSCDLSQPVKSVDLAGSTDVVERVRKVLDVEAESLVALRRELHQIPELALDLPQTASRVRAEFEALGCEITDAREVSGFVAVLRGGGYEPGDKHPTVLLRADMDALPVVEETGVEWASTNGAMHACGHDMHMAGIVGAARALHAVRDRLVGDVLFFLQPGEEGWDGAQHLIDEGLLEASGAQPDHAYGLHVWSGRFPSGIITTRPGALMASTDSMHIEVKGRGGHGSAPFLALDPVPVIAEIITQSHVAVTREFDISDPVVATCGAVLAGTTSNVIPDSARASFTLRTFSEANRQRLPDVLERLARGIAAAHGMDVVVEREILYPPTINDVAEAAFVEQVTDAVFPGRFAELPAPLGAGEDFSKILQRIPGCYVFVSAVPEGVDAESAPFNHSPRAFYDDSYLTDCSLLLASLAVARLCP